jgi:pterin-4a-carbinolamine dehydratase/5'(3')-deoxyribonucleotidase
MRFFEFQNEEAAGVGIVTKQNATADVPVGGEYMNVKKLFPKKKKKQAKNEMEEGKFRARDIEEKLISNKKLNDLKSKYLPDWEMLDHRILQAKYVAKDHRHAEDFISYINKVSEEMDHFAEVTQDVSEVTVKTTTFDVKGLTVLDFKLALKIDKFADQNEIEQVRMQGNFGMHEDWRTETVAYEDAFQEIDANTKIYVDMDGVLADFFGEWKKLTGKDWREINKDELEPALGKIRDTDGFWLKLPLTSNAKSLLSLIKQVKGEYYILSSPLAGDPKAEPHKREWVEKNLDFFPPAEVIITHNKEKYAQNPDGTPNILIDDYGVNIDKWEGAGGIGFKHKDHKFERTADKLKAAIADSRDYFIDSIRKYIIENFADGKKPGRKGLAKRSGVNTKASVSSLRKTAKNSSGEKQRMAHWLANMKAGKAKKGK